MDKVKADKVYKILVVAPAWVGDMVMSQTLLKALQKQYLSACQIDLLVNDWASHVALRMPEVSKVHLNPFKHGELGLIKRFKFGRSLRAEKYDQCFVLPNSFKSALIPFFAGIPKRIGFVGEMRYGFLNENYRLNKEDLPLMIDRFCALANHGHRPQHIDYPRLNVSEQNQIKMLNKLGLDLNKKVICLCPAAEYGPSKRWPTTHFAKLATVLQQQNYQVWIMGSVKDESIAREIISEAQISTDLHNLCGQTDLVQVVDLLACAKVVVSNDSGLMHIACAVNVPVIAIYGSSSPEFTPPLSNQAIIKKIDIECSPCFERTCRFGHYNCLKYVLPEQVLLQVNQLTGD